MKIIKFNKLKPVVLIHKNHSITEDECQKLADKLQNDFLLFEYWLLPQYIIWYMEKRSSIFRRLKTAKQLELFLLWMLRDSDFKSQTPQFDILENEDDYNHHENMFRYLCGFEYKKKIDEKELLRQKIEERRQKREQAEFEKSIIDITDNPQVLEKTFQGYKPVSATGILIYVYRGGKPGMPQILNLIIEIDGYKVYMAIYQKHLTNDIDSKIDNYKGEVRVYGKITPSSYHKKRNNISNRIESIDRMIPIEFLEDDSDNSLIPKLIVKGGHHIL